MDHTLLQALQRCYRGSDALVLLLDESWSVLWTNRECSDLPALPSAIGLPTEHSGNTVQQLIYRNTPHQCRILHNKEDGLRIAEITPLPSPTGTILQMDVDAITASVQSMTSACHALHAELMRMDLYDQTPLLNVMIGNCYRIYRMAYLQKELNRLEGGMRREDYFSVHTLLRNTLRKAASILQPCVEADMELCAAECFLQGDMDEFTIAVLSAIVLCTHGSEHFQHLHIGLTQEDGTAVLQLQAEETSAALPDDLRQSQEIGSCAGEHALLDTFCTHHHGSWLYAQQPQAQIRSCTLRFQTAPHDGGNLALFSPREAQEGRFYNQYEILLSCIRYRRMF